MNGKICIITGANSGIGKATAMGLSELGATVVMICRDKNRGEAAKKEIISNTSNSNIDLLVGDLSSPKSIIELVKTFKSKYQKLNVLINNAGVMPKRRILTSEGFEYNFAVNYLAPFLLSNLLIDILKKSAPSRIINVASQAHKFANLDLEDLQCEKEYSIQKAYGKSKVALLLFTYKLAQQLKGTDVTVNALHPGVVNTNLGHELSKFSQVFAKAFFKNPKKGALTSIYLASSAEVENVSGKYFINKKEAKSSKETYDMEKAERLWEISKKLTSLNI